MDAVLAVLLFLHVGGAIVAFGPVFAFPVIGTMAAREPQHGNFALRLAERLSSRMVLPLAILQGVTGVLLIWKTGINVSQLWLGLGIILYGIALTISIGVTLPTTRELVRATATAPAAPAPGAVAAAGPPPQVAALVRRQRRAGAAAQALIVVIVFLMVVKPTL